MKILVVEDELEIADVVLKALVEQGMAVSVCANGTSAYELAANQQFDCIILDIMLPGRDGISILKELRQNKILTPIILLTARNELGDRLDGLNFGADDYLAKPFFVEELIARIAALRRRISGESQQLLQVGTFVLDLVKHQIQIEQSVVALTTREFNLLECLMRSPGQIFTREQILDQVWGYDFDPSTNIVEVCIRRIRTKIASLSNVAAENSPIQSVRKAGYRFEEI
ncbi:response regulator transcription factor [Sapientia aquatica]|uniref:Response regulator transcription factor n=1 Tax=Sapientia aquatica TaxID=1549640 RepID=A0A4R5W3Z9_9BURK|nr:response regulator transcription factor [Sapientia aquatica]TDK66378.1 response regulator transcription factor [Sapientia aquatica]